MGPHGQAPDFDPGGIDFDALAAALPLQRASGLGSNAWALSGEHTDSGKPLLANDPHLRLEVPSVWYLAHISTPEFEVVGATLPGMPFPLLGRTRNLAWGFTNTGPDVQDLFIERIDPEDPARYLAPEGSLPFEVRSETIEVSGGRSHRAYGARDASRAGGLRRAGEERGVPGGRPRARLLVDRFG